MFNALLISGTMIGIIAAIVLVLLVVIILGWYISTRNNFVKLRNTCEESDSTINVYLKKRYDLIPNLVETVKGYAKHESETLEKVIAARNSAMNAQGTAAKAEAEDGAEEKPAKKPAAKKPAAKKPAAKKAPAKK